MPSNNADISWVLCIELGDGTLLKVSAERLVTENEAEWDLTFISAVSDPESVITDYFCPKLLNTVSITILEPLKYLLSLFRGVIYENGIHSAQNFDNFVPRTSCDPLCSLPLGPIFSNSRLVSLYFGLTSPLRNTGSIIVMLHQIIETRL